MVEEEEKEGAIFKLDFRKAYDSIRWDFLEHMLFQIGLGPRMRQWLMWCIRIVRISIMVNGSPTIPFSMEKGVR